MASERITLTVPGPDGDREVGLSSPNRVLWPELGITKHELAEYLLAGVGPVHRRQRRSARVARAVPRGGRRRAVLLEEPAQGRAVVRRAQYGDVQQRAAASAARPRRVGDGGLGGADEHDRLPPVGVAHGRTPTTRSSCASTSTRSRAPASRTPPPSRPRCARCSPRRASTAFIKTSGNRGLHVFCPIEPTHEFLDVRHAVIAAGRELERRLPDKVTMNWWKEERGERIFIDFNQANRDRTMAGAYSPRALPGRDGVAPLTWEELPDARSGRLHRALDASAPGRFRGPMGTFG